ncbi:MAG TPA: AHH domain-containing protein [Polyangium sp.]|nr:AHH domain-containing protein [Polyangium sp.]
MTGAYCVAMSTMTTRVNTELLALATFSNATQRLMLSSIFRQNGMLNGPLKDNRGTGNRFQIVNGNGCRGHCGEKAGPENGAKVGEGAAGCARPSPHDKQELRIDRTRRTMVPRFEDMSKKAGMTLEDAANRVRIPGHGGPHPEVYHREVYRRLDFATDGLSGNAYTRAFRAELERIRIDAATSGSKLNSLVVKP